MSAAAAGSPWSRSWGVSTAQRDEFDAAYAGIPPWDIGRPQPALRQLADTGQLRGNVLDVGCGTGEHALMAAELGLEASGVDIAATAIAIATRKARERALSARFLVHDVLALAGLGDRFDTALDCGLFHVLPEQDRPRLAASLHAALVPGARYHLLCFSDRQPGHTGPSRVRRDEIHAAFATGWHIDTIDPSTIELINRPPAQAWLATLTRR